MNIIHELILPLTPADSSSSFIPFVFPQGKEKTVGFLKLGDDK